MSVVNAKSEIRFRVLHRIAQDSLESLQIDNLPIQYQSLHQDYLNEYHARDGHQKRVRFLEIAVGSRLVGLACIGSVSARDQGLGSTRQRLELTQIVFNAQISSVQGAEIIRKGADFLLPRKSEWTSEPSIGVSQKMSDPFIPLLVQQAGFVAPAVSAEMRIDLTKGEAPLFTSLRKKHRQQIRKYCDLTRVSVRTNVDALQEMQ